MIAVADSSVLIALSGLCRLPLLRERFPGGIIVPAAVWSEVVEQGSGRPGAEAVRTTDWITVRHVMDYDYVRLLKGTLDVGEAEAIALAREQKADAVLLDDKSARAVAVQLGSRVLGTVGLLLWARQRGFLDDLGREISRLQKDAGFHIAESVITAALKAAGEHATTEA